MKTHNALHAQVMTGLEHLFVGDGNYIADLPDEVQNLVLILSARALADFCDANEGKHEVWGVDESTWAAWIANGRTLVAETDALLGPWPKAWLDGPELPKLSRSAK
jgi:hypothetical protein